jgi:tRNA(Ile)-lysidine synthase
MVLYDALKQHWATLQHARRLCIGFSGGVDSHSLLHSLVALAGEEPLPPIVALHINHGLHAKAAQWEEHCAGVAAQLGVDFVAKSVLVSPGASPEAQARDARYEAFSRFLLADDLLLLAHHLDDQVETVLFRLIRGAGPKGLAGMPEKRQLGNATLVRPLLGLPRSDIEQYAIDHELEWLTDSSNDDVSVDRNYLRHHVLPVIESRWPRYRQGFSRSATLSGLSHSAGNSRELPAGLTPLGDPCLSVATQDVNDLHSQLYTWLERMGASIPNYKVLSEFARQCVQGAEDRLPELQWEDYLIQRWKREIHVYPFIPKESFTSASRIGEAATGPWGAVDWAVAEFGLPAGEKVTIRSAHPGEMITLRSRPTRSMSQCFQEANIPPYWRSFLPIICRREVPIALADLGLSVRGDTEAESLCKGGLVPVWRRPKLHFLN